MLIACGAGTDGAFCGGSSRGNTVSVTINTGSCPSQTSANTPAPAQTAGGDETH